MHGNLPPEDLQAPVNGCRAIEPGQGCAENRLASCCCLVVGEQQLGRRHTIRAAVDYENRCRRVVRWRTRLQDESNDADKRPTDECRSEASANEPREITEPDNLFISHGTPLTRQSKCSLDERTLGVDARERLAPRSQHPHTPLAGGNDQGAPGRSTTLHVFDPSTLMQAVS